MIFVFFHNILLLIILLLTLFILLVFHSINIGLYKVKFLHCVIIILTNGKPFLIIKILPRWQDPGRSTAGGKDGLDREGTQIGKNENAFVNLRILCFCATGPVQSERPARKFS